MGSYNCGLAIVYLADRDQSCCTKSYHAQDRPPQQKIIQSQVSLSLVCYTHIPTQWDLLLSVH
jgi:hypothetical protein